MRTGRRWARRWTWGLLLCVACGGSKEPAPGGEAPREPAEIGEARSLLAAGRFDEVLARLQNSRSPEALYLEAEAWAGKAETAPLPTPEALPPGSPRDAVPATPEFKPEELQAIERYEKAAASLPKDPRPRAGLAKLMAPHAERRYDAEQAAAAAVATRKGRAPVPTPVPAGPDFSPAAVAGLYRQAAELSSNAEPLEALYAFAVRVGQLEEAGWALQERIRRDNENPDHTLRYGDFLRDLKKEPIAAVDQYRQVLIWRPQDAEVKARIGDVYLGLGREHHRNGEYATAEARYKEAQKWLDRGSPRYAELQQDMERLRNIRR